MYSTFSRAALPLALLLVAACGGTGPGTVTPSNPMYAGKTVSLGAVLSLTGAGAVYGVNSKNGIDLAIDDINHSGGVNGAQVSVDVQDDASSRDNSASVADQLIKGPSHPIGLVGPTLSNSAVAVHPLANGLHVPIMGISTTGLHIVPDCQYPQPTVCTYVFRDSLGEASAIPANVRAWQAAHASKTATLLVVKDDKFSADGGQIVKMATAANGIRLVDTVEFSKEDPDLASPVRRALQSQPDVVFITGLGSIPARLMIEARKQGFGGGFLGGNGFNTAVVSKAVGAAGLGAQSASAWYINSPFPVNRTFVKAYRARYSIDPDQFAAQAYSSMLIYAAAAKAAHLTFSDMAADRDQLRAAMEKVSIDTPLGPFRFTSEHDVSQTIWIMQMDGAGGFRPVSSVSPG
jgi:branched-chain amino acid transport system substrate-binding protein